jgi:predicted alpha-1,2-mannosidase
LYFDSADHFFKGNLSDGSRPKDFEPLRANNKIYAEGNAWQYLWLVPQDVKGMIGLLGGDAAFNQRLDSFFQIQSVPDAHDLADLTGVIGQYAHGNEPSHHIAYLYAYSGQQWKTAEKLRYILQNFYQDKPDGIIGNEDCGQMSAWYIFTSMGLYPVFPASGQYVFGTPLFDKATFHLGNGRSFSITAENNGPGNIYIQQILLNGKKYSKTYLTHQDLMKGGYLTMVMGSHPNAAFGQRAADRPFPFQ